MNHIAAAHLGRPPHAAGGPPDGTDPASVNILVSVRDVDEALLAARGGADFIDLKDPAAGALGGLPLPTIAAIVAALRRGGHGQPVSATIGDLAMDDAHAVLERVHAVGQCGVQFVKVGVQTHPHTARLLQALSQCGRPVVPVFLADQGLDDALLAQACAARHPAVMLDTADKLRGSLFDVMGADSLRAFIDRVRAAGAMAGLAGALRAEHWPQLARLRPDFAGFRSAVCVGHRAAALDAGRLAALRAQRQQALHRRD